MSQLINSFSTKQSSVMTSITINSTINRVPILSFSRLLTSHKPQSLLDKLTPEVCGECYLKNARQRSRHHRCLVLLLLQLTLQRTGCRGRDGSGRFARLVLREPALYADARVGRRILVAAQRVQTVGIGVADAQQTRRVRHGRGHAQQRAAVEDWLYAEQRAGAGRRGRDRS